MARDFLEDSRISEKSNQTNFTSNTGIDQKLRSDTNPVIQRALRVLAESSARDIKETNEKVIIYKPTYQYCADNERLKWKLDLAEARLRRKERELVTSDYEEERGLFDEKRLRRKNKKSESLAALERIERRLSTVEKALPEKKYITQLNTSLEKTLPSNYGEPVELAKISTNPPGPRVHESKITIVPNYRSRSRGRGRSRSRSRTPKSVLESSVERLRASSERSSRVSRAESETIAAKNIEIGSLKEQIRTLQNQISQTQSTRSIALSSSSVFVDDDGPPMKRSEINSSSQTSLMKHLDELQYENESLNNTVRELRDRLMLHSQADDSENETEEPEIEKSENSAEEKAKSNPSSYAAPYYPTSNIFRTH